MSPAITVSESPCEGPTIAACVLGRHEAPACGRVDCPLVRTLGRRMRDLRAAGAAADADRELDKYRAIARVLACPILGAAMQGA